MTARTHNYLRHRLPPKYAAAPVTAAWIRHRIANYLAAAGTTHQVTLALTTSQYLSLTGRAPTPDAIGSAYRDSRDHTRRVIYLDLTRLSTRGHAELELAHEMMHIGWWSYAHRPVAWARCQSLIDRVEAPSC